MVRLAGLVAAVSVKVPLVSDGNALPFGGAGRTGKPEQGGRGQQLARVSG
jgi:hypothetical protein